MKRFLILFSPVFSLPYEQKDSAQSVTFMGRYSMNMRIYLIFIVVCAFVSGVHGQIDSTIASFKSTHSLSLSAQFSQFKDQFNYGLVFNGPSLRFAYGYSKTKNDRTLTLNSELEAAATFNKGTGIGVHLQPLEVFYGVERKQANFTIGAYSSIDYQWQLYPDVQSGQVFWLSSWDFGPKLIKGFNFRSQPFSISIAHSLAAITSRPSPSVESYFYSLRFGDFIKSAHSNLSVHTVNRFNHTQFRFSLLPNEKRTFSVSYTFEYFGYYRDPKISIIQHGIRFNWKIGRT